MIWATIDEIREAYCDAIEPLVKAQTESMKRCKNRYEIGQCIAAYGKLHLAEYDRVCQRFGLPPVEYHMPKAVSHDC